MLFKKKDMGLLSGDRMHTFLLGHEKRASAHLLRQSNNLLCLLPQFKMYPTLQPRSSLPECLSTVLTARQRFLPPFLLPLAIRCDPFLPFLPDQDLYSCTPQPADPLPAFRDFVNNEKTRLTQKRQAMMKNEMGKRMAEFLKFSQNFKVAIFEFLLGVVI
jgi:hypothetical protein